MTPLASLPVNTQPAEGLSRADDGSLDVIEVFHTLQGEGPFAGRPAIFVRLAGCQLACPGCDTEYTDGRHPVTAGGLAREVLRLATDSPNTDLVVVTGGEPFRQNITPFVNLLLASRFTVQVETNGGLFLESFPYNNVAVICSPKLPKVHERLLPFVTAWKYILEYGSVNLDDGLPHTTLRNQWGVARPPTQVRVTDVFVQPQDDRDPERNKLNKTAAVSSCLQFGYRLSIQVHKECGLP